jgi:hypothetical protein
MAAAHQDSHIAGQHLLYVIAYSRWVAAAVRALQGIVGGMDVPGGLESCACRQGNNGTFWCVYRGPAHVGGCMVWGVSVHKHCSHVSRMCEAWRGAVRPVGYGMRSLCGGGGLTVYACHL